MQLLLLLYQSLYDPQELNLYMYWHIPTLFYYYILIFPEHKQIQNCHVLGHKHHR